MYTVYIRVLYLHMYTEYMYIYISTSYVYIYIHTYIYTHTQEISSHAQEHTKLDREVSILSSEWKRQAACKALSFLSRFWAHWAIAVRHWDWELMAVGLQRSGWVGALGRGTAQDPRVLVKELLNHPCGLRSEKSFGT